MTTDTPKPEALAALRAWHREGTRQARDRMTDALRRALGDRLDRKAAYLGDALDVLRAWAKEEANVEALVEWLDRGGWKAVDADKVEACLVTAAQAAAAGTDMEGLWSFVWTRPDEATLLVYHEKRSNAHPAPGYALRMLARALETVLLPERTADLLALSAAVKAATQSGITLLTVRDREGAKPEGPQPKAQSEGPETLRGFDALRAGLQAHDWPTLTQTLDPADDAADWLGLLAGAWLKDRLPRAEREARAVAIALRPKATTEAGAAWTPMPRALDIASALGGPFVVDVDGDNYVAEPSLAPDAVGYALRPRSFAVVPEEWLGKPGQLPLPLLMGSEAVDEYLIEAATKTARLAEFPRLVPKLLGLMFATAPMTKTPIKATLLDLAHCLYPDWSTGEGPTVRPWKEQRQGKRNLEAIGAAFVAVKSLRWISEQPNGVRRVTDLFVVDYELSAKPEAQVGFMLNPFLADRMQKGQGGGWFLLNMTRWLTLGTQNPRLFALALRLAALWDRAREKNGPFYLERLPPIEADQLAYLCNTLSEGAAMYRTGKTTTATAKGYLKEARANLEADLDALREAGLLGNWKPTMQKVHGKGWNLVPIPPDDYAEACRLALKTVNAAREKGRPKRG